MKLVDAAALAGAARHNGHLAYPVLSYADSDGNCEYAVKFENRNYSTDYISSDLFSVQCWIARHSAMGTA
jgi:hypothetical protein